jgi:hypothetical protein
VIGFGKERGFGEELASARRMQDHEMVIDGAADQAQPTAFNLIDRRRPVALIKQDLAPSEVANNALSLKQGWQIIARGHRVRYRLQSASTIVCLVPVLLVVHVIIEFHALDDVAAKADAE